MFKFFRSPKQPSPQPSATDTSPNLSAGRPTAQPPPVAPAPSNEEQGLHGLGLNVPVGELGARVEVRAPGSSSTRTRESGSRRPSAAQPPQVRERDFVSSPAGAALERAISPASLSPSASPVPTGFQSPYGGSIGAFSASERDPSQIYAPTTWSEMAHQELVVNVSARERMRQEILWEVVASEERYVAELRSLVDLYANPLLHPLLTNPSSPAASPYLSSVSPYLGTSSPNPASPPESSSSDLPIAAKFARSTASLAASHPPARSHADIPEIADADSPPLTAAARFKAGFLGRSSLPALPTGARTVSASSFEPPVEPSNGGGRLASFGFRTRHPLRPASAGAKLHKSTSKAPAEVLSPPKLPDALKQVLEATVEMLKGHEELSSRLKEQWARAFPLVRGLASIWSEQPWFLETYARYIVALEEALAIIDACLPSPHSPNVSKLKLSTKNQADKDEKRLARTLMRLEERAAEAGESSLGICLSKPLMRLSKLPLLMQALLYHTDPTTHEWEKTRAMALEVDALVRSIEDEKIEEEERERTRDAFARIEGINDKALMAPRSSRIVIEEIPAPHHSSQSARGKTSRKLASSNGKGRSPANDWLIRFTDVVIRAQKVGETNIPGSFSREKEKQGKQGKTRKTGKNRNTYRFIRVERWELPETAEAAFLDMNGMQQAIAAAGQNDAESSISEVDNLDAESRMSFRYDADEPQPSDHRTFSPLSTKKASARGRSHPLAPTTAAKFGGRLRVGSEDVVGMRMTSPTAHHRFDSPTMSSSAKVARRTASTPTTAPPPPRTVPPPAQQQTAPTGLAHARDESTFGLYSIWAAQDT